MSLLSEIFVTVPIVVSLSYLSLLQVKFYSNALKETKKFKVEIFKEEENVENEEIEFEKYLERKKYLSIGK
jgi:hypothetical protein